MIFTEVSENKHCGAKRFLKEFPAKQWSLSGLNKILNKIDQRA